MKTTQEYFNMDINKLLDSDEYRHTREEKKVLDEGLKVHFSDDKEYKEEREDVINWYKTELGLELILELEMINKRVAMIFK